MVIEKLNLRSSSKPRANEKTTATDDDDDNECNSGAPPSPVVEENESPDKQKHLQKRRISTQNSPRKDSIPKANLPN